MLSIRLTHSADIRRFLRRDKGTCHPFAVCQPYDEETAGVPHETHVHVSSNRPPPKWGRRRHLVTARSKYVLFLVN